MVPAALAFKRAYTLAGLFVVAAAANRLENKGDMAAAAAAADTGTRAAVEGGGDSVDPLLDPLVAGNEAKLTFFTTLLGHIPRGCGSVGYIEVANRDCCSVVAVKFLLDDDDATAAAADRRAAACKLWFIRNCCWLLTLSTSRRASIGVRESNEQTTLLLGSANLRCIQQ